MLMLNIILVVKMEALAGRFPLHISGNHLIYAVKNKINKYMNSYPKTYKYI